MNRLARERLSYLILSLCVSLTLAGLVLNYSIRPQLAYSQGLALGVGLVIFYLISRLPFSYLLSLSGWLYGVTVVLLGVVLLADPIRGASRWLSLAGFHLQPSELFKLGLVLFIWRLVWFGQLKKDLRSLSLWGLVLMTPVGLIVLEPDLGTAVLILIGLSLGLTPWYLSVKRVVVVALLALLSLPFVWYQLKPYQQSRLVAFVDPFKDPLRSGYNIIQAKLTIQNGGLTGQLNPLKQYQANLPEAQTDFIFAVWVEDTGLVGGVGLILMYLGLIFVILLAGRYLFEVEIVPLSLIAFFLGFQALVHIAINLGLLPVTGTTLPFISYGRSALITNLALLGVLTSRLRSQLSQPQRWLSNKTDGSTARFSGLKPIP